MGVSLSGYLSFAVQGLGFRVEGQMILSVFRLLFWGSLQHHRAKAAEEEPCTTPALFDRICLPSGSRLCGSFRSKVRARI